MDTSKKYIKMCEKAVEIQKIKPQPEKHDSFPVDCWFYDLEETKSFCIGMYNESNGYCDCCPGDNSFKDSIWLPRQDQLQEMIPGLPINHVLRISKFVDNLDDGSGKILEWDSMEQLWLTFVMAVKYQRRWNDEDWI